MLLHVFIAAMLAAGQLWPAGLFIQARNSIEGRVTTANNSPLERVPVTLLNAGYSQVAMTYTDGIGRYRFANLAGGEYFVQAEPTGMDYERQMQRVDVNPFSLRRGSGEIFRMDIVLTPKKPAGKDDGKTSLKGSNIVFYQEVPEKAKKEYAQGVKSLEKDEFAKAVGSLKRAIEIFPDYYDALELLGTEYVKQKDYNASLPILTRAVEVNRDGWRSFYSLGITLTELKQLNDGIRALRRAVELNPESANTNMRLGMALAQDPTAQTEAIETLKKVIRLVDKAIPDAYLYLASLYSKSNQYSDAANSLESYLGVIPQTEGQNVQREKIQKLISQLRDKAARSVR